MKKLVFFSAVFLCSCGGTKVAVTRPTNGTYTTITVTTNNPITTEVNPRVDSQISVDVEPSK